MKICSCSGNWTVIILDNCNIVDYSTPVMATILMYSGTCIMQTP